MAFTVSQESRDNATKCLFDFQCQQNNPCPMCTVEKEINNYGVFIKNCGCEELCSYRLSYGFTQICLCPVRLEIFKKYRV